MPLSDKAAHDRPDSGALPSRRETSRGLSSRYEDNSAGRQLTVMTARLELPTAMSTHDGTFASRDSPFTAPCCGERLRATGCQLVRLNASRRLNTSRFPKPRNAAIADKFLGRGLAWPFSHK